MRYGCSEIFAFAHFQQIRQKGSFLIPPGLGCEVLLASEDSLHTVAEERRWSEGERGKSIALKKYKRERERREREEGRSVGT